MDVTWLIYALALVSVSWGLSVNHRARFASGRIVSRVQSLEQKEISGVGASRRHPHVLYSLNDSGGLARIYAFDAHNGSLLARFEISGAMNCDWEDLSVGRGPRGQSYIYIGDVGGNIRSPCQVIYRVREPVELKNGRLDVESKVGYTWDAQNCETLLVDNQGDVFLVSKVLPKETPRLYPIPRSAWGSGHRVRLSQGTPVFIRSSSEGPVGGDISLSGKEVVIKTYKRVYYWLRHDGETLAETLARRPRRVPYREEVQGEAICWDRFGKGYFTTSEWDNQPLWYYARLLRPHPKWSTVSFPWYWQWEDQ